MGVGQEALEGMPEPVGLRLSAGDGQHLVSCGRMLLYRYDADDVGMRNLAIVALTDAGRRVDEVAAVFGLTATYVSMLRGRARRDGSAGLVRRRGRPPKLSGRQVAQARAWAGSGWTQQAIADRLGVARSVISELLARLGPAPVQEALLPACDTEPADAEPADAVPADAVPADAVPADAVPAQAEPAQAEPAQAEPTESEPAQAEPTESEPAQAEPTESEPAQAEPTDAGPAEAEPAGAEPADAEPARAAGSARIVTGCYRCRYAGAMLLHPYLDLVGARGILAR